MKPAVIEQNQELDPFKVSDGMLLTVAFPKSRSKQYPIALAIYERVVKRGTAEIGGTTYHVAAFEKNREDGSLCKALLECTKSMSGVMMFIEGMMVDDDVDIRLMIDCYCKSHLVKNPAAHCLKIIDDPKYKERRYSGHVITINPVRHIAHQIDQYSFPCKLLWQHMNLNPDHPASYQEQMQAVAVEHSIHTCPRFDPANFQITGNREVLIADDTDIPAEMIPDER